MPSGRSALNTEGMGERHQCRAAPGDFDALAMEMISLLPEEDRARMLNGWKGKCLYLASVCSGTDICVRVLRAVAKQVGVAVRHRFSCDNSVAVQQWIASQFADSPPDFHFKDVLSFHESAAFDVRSARTKPMPPVDTLYLGFSCKDVSHLNRRHTEARTCVRAGSLRIGSTLAASAAYVAKMRPKFFFLENASALEDCDPAGGSSNADEVETMFLRIGYVIFSVVLDARQHGSAQWRRRWWGAAFQVSSGPVSAQQAKAFDPARRRLQVLLAKMETQPMPLEKFLFE